MIQLPIIKVDFESGMEEIANLLRNPPEDYICQKAPVKCEENATFLIDTEVLMTGKQTIWALFTTWGR